MKVIVFGATGRVGAAVVEQATKAGHDVTAFVRDPKRLKADAAGITVAVGDVYEPESLVTAMRAGFDAVVMAVGADPLKPSTLVTDSVRAIVNAMKATGLPRYLGVTGTAEMPEKTLLGRFATRLLRLTPVGHAVRDHDAAYSIVVDSGVKFTLAGCPYIKDGPRRGAYRESLEFPGGFKTIHPGDVADFFVRELADARYPNKVVGLWY